MRSNISREVLQKLPNGTLYGAPHFKSAKYPYSSTRQNDRNRQRGCGWRPCTWSEVCDNPKCKCRLD